MDLDRYRCIRCDSGTWRAYTTLWRCEACNSEYACVSGIPRLYQETEVDQRDRALRDFFYNGILGRFYQHIMPFLALPVRPKYWGGWIAYVLVIAALVLLFGFAVNGALDVARDGLETLSAGDIAAILGTVAVAAFLARHRYILYLLLLAVPVKLSLLRNRFKPRTAFPDLHARLMAELKQRPGKLRILDISTGTCNSLYRHGWMDLDAEYVGLDLSETMLLQGQEFMASKRVPTDFVLADAQELPFQPETFDVVMNYGALNAYGDAGKALSEMTRVAKPGAVILVLDEQIYGQASAVEKLYFRRVLSSHNIHHRCPVELLPQDLDSPDVQQVYHFYYILTGRKR